MKISLQQKIEGLLIGTAVADAIGLPTEGMTPEKIRKLGWARDLKHRFIFGKGMWSDDTEQTIMLAQSLLHAKGNLQKFTRSFAWELRWWILGMPAATGLATARAIIKLWLGVPPAKSGVWSAGNGAAMRTAPIAAFFPDDAEKRKLFTIAQCRITHSDPKAAIASLAITELCHLLLQADAPPSARHVLEIARAVSDDSEWQEIIKLIESSIEAQTGLPELLESLGASPHKGISGYVYETVPAVILAGVRNRWGFEGTIKELIAAGGDTDTTAAIAGALCGALGGKSCVPHDWIQNLHEWPVRKARLTSLAGNLLRHTPHRIRPRWSPLLILRNLTFLAIVLSHGLARLFPVLLRPSQKS